MAVGIAKQTRLWGVIETKLTHRELHEIERACERAEDLLARIPDTFPTYTLHDATHFSFRICAQSGINKSGSLDGATC